MNKPPMEKKGFTLIELLIVIAVIAILALLAIPNMISSRKSANETNAIAELRVVITAEEDYKARNLGGGLTYATLAQLEGKNLMAWPTVGIYNRNGYTFSNIATPDATNFGIFTTPDDVNSGDRDFLVTNDGRIRSQLTGGTVPTTIVAAQNNTNYPQLQ